MASEDEKPTSSNSGAFSIAQNGDSDQEKSNDISLPAHVAGSGSLDGLVGTARDYARAAASDNTLKAYGKDWAHFARWCRMKGAEPLPPSSEIMGLPRSEIISLDVHKDDTPDSGGWIDIFDEGALLTLNAKTGWREVEIGRGSKDQTCPIHALEQWLHFAKIDFGPVFVGTSRDGKRASETRLNDKHIARLIKRTVLDARIRSELPEKERLALFSGHSLRAGLASSAEVDERYVQKQLGHASAEMTRRYQRRRDRFRVNLTKAAGL